MHTEGRREEKERKEDCEEENDDDEEVVNLRVPSKGEPTRRNKPYSGAYSDLDYDGMNANLSGCLLRLLRFFSAGNSGRETCPVRSDIAASYSEPRQPFRSSTDLGRRSSKKRAAVRRG